MNIYFPGSVFNCRSQSEQISFEEASLPFDEITENNDYLSGEELYSALTSEEVRGSLDNYHISGPRYADGKFEFRAVNDSYLDLNEPSVIAFEGETTIEEFQDKDSVDAEYHHITVELTAPDEEAMEALEEDIELLEEGLRNYYREASSEYYSSERQAPIAD